MLKRQTGVRFRAETDELLLLLAQDMGITRTGVIEFAIHELAKQRGLKRPTMPTTAETSHNDD